MIISPTSISFLNRSASNSSFNRKAGQCSIRMLRNSAMCRVLSALASSCAVLLWSLSASAQAPFFQAGSPEALGPAIDFQNQALTVSVRVVGVPFRFDYRSDAVAPKWRWSVYHAYDPAADIFSPGNGRPRSASPLFGQLAKAPSWLSIGEVAIAAQDGSELYVFNQRGDHLRTLNPLTDALLYRFNYSDAGTLTSIEDGYGNSTRIERDATGLVTAVVAPHGQRTTISSDAKGYPTRITDPLGGTISLDYAADGQLVAFTDAKKNVYRFTADQQGRLTKLESPAGGLVNLAQISSNTGRRVSWNTAMGRTSEWRVEQTADGETSAVMTDADGSETQLLARTDSNSKTTYSDGRTLTRERQPDPRWGLHSALLKTTSMSTPSGLTSTVSVNRTVALADSSDPLSLTTLTDTASINGQNYTQIFDAKSRQITQLTPAGRRAIATLDEHGRAVKVELPGLNPISLSYDGQGRLAGFAQGTGAEARVGSVVYNAKGGVASVTDPIKRAIRFEYDAGGRINKRILQDGREISYTYDANGNNTSITPPERPAHSFAQTPLNLIAAYLPPHLEPGSANSEGKKSVWATVKSYLANLWDFIKSFVRKLLGLDKATVPAQAEQGHGETRFVYDNDGQLTKIRRPDHSAIDIAYDKGGRISAVTNPEGPVRFTYDPKTARLTSVAVPDGSSLAYAYDGALLTRAAWTGTINGTVSFTYDNNLRTSSTSVNGESPFTLEYDSDGLLTRAGSLDLKRDPVSGLLTGSLLGSVGTATEYNGFGDLTLVRDLFKDQEIFSDRRDRDAGGRTIRRNETIDGQTREYRYAYDPAGRLTDVTTNGARTAHYDYDANGNRVAYVGANGAVKASYDVQDRLMQYGTTTYASSANGEWSSKTAEGKTTEYRYDDFGNLRSVALPNGTKIDYLSDGANRRIAKKVNGKLVQGFLYQDGLKVIAELDGQNQVVARFIYATSPNVPDYMAKGGTTFRILTDELGSPRIVIDSVSGAIAQRMDYDEFGNVLHDTNPGFQPFGFAGGIYDQDTGLTRFGARDYDASTGRWTAKDSILFGGDDSNLFAYVRNDPLNAIDPVGLWVTTVGPSFNGWTGGHAFTGSFGLAVGNNGETSFYGSFGFGVGIGSPGWSTGASVMEYPNSSVPADIEGPFENLSVGAGAGSAGSGDIAVDPSNPSNNGFGGTVGFGGGAGGFFGTTYTKTWGLPWWAQIPTGYGGWFGGIFGGFFADTWHCYGYGSGITGPASERASGCGSGTGDIHMATLNGLRYDMQAAGEFVASQDPAGQVKIQIRLEPDESKRVSFCTAVAALVDGAKLAVHLKPQPQVYLDGQPAQRVPGRGMRVGKAGRITFTGDSWLISWPDGTGASIKSSGAYCDLIVRPGSSAGKLVGLLGKGGGNSTGDLVSRDGVVLATGFSSADLYGHFAESWRISQDESLFHYAKGESTATFTDRSVPRQNVTVASLDPAARAEAERVCRGAGITTPAALADCTLDFAVTGDRRFLSSAALVQAVSREPPASPAEPVGSPTAELKSGIQIVPPDWGSPPWRWEVMKVGRLDEVVQALDGAHLTMPLAPGEYQVATKPTQFDGQRVVWPQTIQVQTGQPVTLKLDSGARLDMAQDLGPLYQWWLVRPEKPDQAVQRQNGDQRVMLVPAGEYQVTTLPTQFASQPVLWPQKIQVQSGEPVTIKLDSGARLDVAQDLGPLFQWWLVHPEKTDEAVQRQNGDQRVMLVPAGEYQVTTLPTQFASQPVLWPQKIQVQSGEPVAIKLDSGVRLDIAKDLGPLFQWWLVRPEKPDQAVQRQNGDQRVMLVPAGEYQVTTKPTLFDSQPVLWPQKIQVQPGQPLTFKASSGVRMIGPPGAGTGFDYQILNDQNKNAQSGLQTWNTQALPPGTYSLQMRRQFGQWKTVVEQIHVSEGQIAEVHVSQLPPP